MKFSAGNNKTYPAKAWLKRFGLAFLSCLSVIALLMVVLDPFFHYHAPLPSFYYTLADQRYQNDGILRHFHYDAVITGTSMVEKMSTRDFDDLFHTTSVKTAYPGATFREIGDSMRTAFRSHPDIRIVLRGLDYSHLVEDPRKLRTDMGDYPSYLYDDNPFNDVRYLFNRDAFLQYLLPMIGRRLAGRPGGVMSFDEFSGQDDVTYSALAALEGKTAFHVDRNERSSLTPEETEWLLANIRENVTSLAEEHPDTEFLCFFTPYSAVWYGGLLENGGFGKQLEAERIAAEEMLRIPNIRLFSFSAEPAITAELDHYRDAGHYSPEISGQILAHIAAGEYELTGDSLASYLASEEALYRGLDYEALSAQAVE